LGRTFDSSTGFHLPDDSVLSPDASWIERSRWEALSPAERKVFAPICPDVAFELASSSDKLPTVRDKIRAYLRNGAKLAVLISPKDGLIEIHRPNSVEIVREPGNVPLDPELPGFTLDARAILQG
jgi:Uma2 family endonuclease